jgi:hypothetical protein
MSVCVCRLYKSAGGILLGAKITHFKSNKSPFRKQAFLKLKTTLIDFQNKPF